MVNCIRPINILNKLIFLIIVYVWNDISMYILLLREDRNISSVERRVFFFPRNCRFYKLICRRSFIKRVEFLKSVIMCVSET